LNTFFFYSIYFSQLNKLSLNWVVQSIGPPHLDPTKISEFEERLNNYPARLWGDKYIDQIQASDLEHFIEWRKTHGLHSQSPSLSTIKRDIVPIKGLFRFAYGKKYISQQPTFEKINASNKQRPAFTIEEWVKVVESLDKWILKVKHLHRRHLRDRVYLKYYILILGLSGIRPGTEARSLTWNSLTFEHFSSKNTGAWVIRVPTGKSGKRTVVADTSLNQHVKDLKEFRRLELTGLDKTWNDGEPVFCHEDGSPIHSFKTGFRSFLKEFELLMDHAGDTRVPYSLRHTYATRMINHGINHWDIAKNMGTSVAMLEKTYVHGNYKIYGINLADPDGTAPEQPIAVDSSLPITLPTPTYSLTPPISPTLEIRKIAAMTSKTSK
jgi:integrase